MSVGIIWSTTNGGASIASTVDLGAKSNGEVTDAQEIFLRHDGVSDITNCAMYMQAFAGTYAGSATAAADYTELVSWGDEALEADFGGVLINWDATGSYATAWPTYAVPQGAKINVVATGYGETSGTAITIPAVTGASSAGTIQAGSSPNVRFKVKVQIPDAEDTVGIRMFDLVLLYDYTS